MPRWVALVVAYLLLTTGLGHNALADTEAPPKNAEMAQPASNISKDERTTPDISNEGQPYWDLVDGDTLPIHVSNEESKDGATFVTVQASVNGTVGTFVLDTGAAAVYLSPAFEDALHLAARGTQPVAGFGGVDTKAKLVILDNIALGRSVLHDVKALVTPLHVPIQVDGILGYPLFSSAMVSVLFYQRQMILHDPKRSALTVTPESYAFDVDLSGRVPSVEGTVDGSAFRAVFDTGNAFELVLPPRFFKPTDAPTSWYLPAGGLGGIRALQCSLVNSLTLGAIQFSRQVACFSGIPILGANAGSVGTTLLRHYDWTIDYPDKKFVLTPNGL